MILYSTIGTADMDRAVKFYDAVFGALGVSRAEPAGRSTRPAASADVRARLLHHGNSEFLTFGYNARGREHEHERAFI